MTSELVPYQPGGSNALAILDRPDGLDFCRTVFEDMGIAQKDLTRIKVPTAGGTAFEVPTLGEPDYKRTLDCVVVFTKNRQRVWYAQAYEESGGGSAPDCQSFDGITGHGYREIDLAMEAQEARENGDEPPPPQTYTCGVREADPDCCPWNKFGSSRSPGGAGKDCAEQAHLYFFHGSQLLPMLLIVPATSIGNWRAYRNKLANFGTFPTDVVTRIGLEPATSATGVDYSKLTFEASASIDPEHLEQFRTLGVMVKEAFRDYDPNR